MRRVAVLAGLAVLVAAASGIAAGTGEVRVVEHVTVDATPSTPGSYEVTYRYEVPDRVEALTVRVPALSAEGSVVEVRGFERTGPELLTWSRGSGTPSVTVRVPASTDRLPVGGAPGAGRAVERGSWAFVVPPVTTHSVDVSGGDATPTVDRRLTVEGEGYAHGRYAYAGPYEAANASGNGTTVRVVAAQRADPTPTAGEIAGAVATMTDRFAPGGQEGTLAVFVLPSNATAPGVTGRTVADAVWVDDALAATDRVPTALTHEYVHTQLGGYRNESVRWLTEGAATYYQHLLAIRMGMGSFRELRRAIRGENYAPDRNPVVLTDPATWRGTDADYEKGAQVLAALDARIHNATDGARRLRDVFLREERYDGFAEYADFRRAVVAVAGSESVGDWLDTYARTERLPPIPSRPHLYTRGPGADPDGDGLPNGRERSLGSGPFGADSDGDGLDDAREATAGTDPRAVDSDDDGLRDRRELDGATDPVVGDTDGDGLPDGEERRRNTNATTPDTDGDGTPDANDDRPRTDSPDAGTATATSGGNATSTGGATRTEPTVEKVTPEPGRAPGVSGPGFGVVVTVLAVLAAALLGRRSRPGR